MTFFNKFNKPLVETPKIKETTAKSLQDLKKKKEEEVVEETPSIKKAGRPKGSKNQSKKKKEQPKRKYEKRNYLTGKGSDFLIVDDPIIQGAEIKPNEDVSWVKNDSTIVSTPRIMFGDKNEVPALPVLPSKPNETAERSKNLLDDKPYLFKPGNPGSPGRPEGSKAKTVLALEKIGLDNADALMEKMIELGKQGDVSAGKFVLERILPPAKGRRVKLNLPFLENISAIGEAMNVIIEEMAAGNITLEEAETATKVVEIKLKSFEMNDLEKRLLILEEAKESLK